MRIEPFDPRSASRSEYEAATAFANRMQAEKAPEDPPVPIEERIQKWRNIPTFVEVHVWQAWRDDAGGVVAAGSIHFLRKDENRHLAEFDVSVLPEHRRRGIGRKLLALVAGVAEREGRTLLVAQTASTIPAGAAFMNRIGASMVLAGHQNQLDLEDLDRGLLRRWQERAQERASGFALGLWEGGYPEESIDEVAVMFESINQAPRDGLEMEDFHWTPQQIREFERMERARGNQTWTMYARDRKSGRIAGFTEVAWNPNRPDLLEQRGTAVFAEFQNLGLGRWLKAAMLEKVLADRPEVRFVRTGNADSNAPMLKINTELGFKPHRAGSAWQVPTETALAYLREAGRS